MKRILAAVLSICIFAALPACQATNAPAGAANSASPAASPDPSPGPSATIPDIDPGIPYVDLGFKVPYETIPPVNPDRAKELRIALPEDMELPRVIALPDGGALALGLRATGRKQVFAEPSTLMAARYDAAGNRLWTKGYDDLPDGYGISVQPFGGDGYAFTYSAPEETNGSKYFIVFCGGDGHAYYQESSSQTFLYQYILDGGPGAIVVGEAVYKNGKPAGDATHGSGEGMLSILVQSAISSVFFSRTLGVEGYFSPMGAVLAPETGLVVAAHKKNTEGGNTSDILAFDPETLERKWRYGREAQGNQYIGGILDIKGGVLVDGFDNHKPFILKLDHNGKKLWEIQPDGGGNYSVFALAAFAGGGFAAAINRYEEGDSMRGEYLALYDPDGNVKRKLRLLNETITQIVPTNGGGLVTVGIQNKKTLPQPAILSSIWYDTETVVTSYDENLTIRWRKVYDKYKDTTQQDVAVPAADGRVIVES